MNKIISLIQYAVLAGCMIGITACGEDFLLKQPPAALAGTTMETPIGVEGLLAGAYAHTTRGDIFGSAMGSDWVYGSGASDDMYKGTTASDQSSFNQVERYETLVDNEYMMQRWRDCYNGISRCNSTLLYLKAAQAGSTPLTATRATQVEAEAKYLRAWFHFSANKVFKNIPYIKTPEEQGGKFAEEIPNPDPGWADIEADLDFAIANLPESFAGEPGRVTKFAALTLKAQALLYQNKLSAAKPLLDQVIGSGRFSLVRNFFDNYNELTENNSESIFELQCASTSTGQSSMRLAGAIQFASGPVAVGGGWGFYQPSQCLVDAFQVDDKGLPYLDITTRPHLKNDMGVLSTVAWDPPTAPVDVRLDWTFARRGIPYLDWAIMTGMSWIREQSNGGPWMTMKYMHFRANLPAQNGAGFDNNRNFRYHRLAHVLLWRAEIAIEDGEFDYAQELVNQIRNRAKGSNKVMGYYSVNVFPNSNVPLTDPNIDFSKPAANYVTEPYPAGHFQSIGKDKAREAVRMEIRLEFASEGQRFFDLRRWGQSSITPNYDVSVLTDYIARDSEFRTFMKGAKYGVNRRYWPIPLLQTELQRDVLVQDPDYKQ
ncbi:MAG: RagB/SusD family nutrient uptake outer membrane protein [Tannerella sp.]|nr:RagB/SusD family nutrient uptake outer membrane protein [Tannerella sp.]